MQGAAVRERAGCCELEAERSVRLNVARVPQSGVGGRGMGRRVPVGPDHCRSHGGGECRGAEAAGAGIDHRYGRAGSSAWLGWIAVVAPGDCECNCYYEKYLSHPYTVAAAASCVKVANRQRLTAGGRHEEVRTADGPVAVSTNRCTHRRAR